MLNMGMNGNKSDGLFENIYYNSTHDTCYSVVKWAMKMMEFFKDRYDL